jgi:ABC-type multidrug transport system fused ATPase/permease subunit
MTIRTLLRDVHLYRGPMLRGVGLTIVIVATQMALPWLIRFVIDEALIRKLPEKLTTGVTYMIICAGIVSISRFAERDNFANLKHRVCLEWRCRVMKRLRRSTMQSFQSYRTGELTALILNDTAVVSGFYELLAGVLVADLLRVVLTTAFLIYLSGPLTAVAAVMIVLYALMAKWAGPRLKAASSDAHRAFARLNGTLLESVLHTREIKAFNREDWDLSRMRAAFESTFEPLRRLTRLKCHSFAIYFLVWCGFGSFFVFAGKRVIAGEMSVGSVLTILYCLNFLDAPISGLARVHGEFQEIVSALGRLEHFLTAETEPHDRADAVEATRACPAIEFDDVVFRYAAGAPVLSGISFAIPPFSKTAIVGSSGVGKTTIVSLLLKFYEPASGAIRYGHEDLRNIRTGSLRTAIATAFQDSVLTSGTIAENIRLGNPAASDAEVVQAASAAGAHRFIESLHEGYDTQIGDRGVRLSGGQRQRIAIARALLAEAPVLILDEATSALDGETEQDVLSLLDKMPQRRTIVVIAHRLSTIAAADQIIVLEGGAVASSGTHEHLLNECDTYRRLYVTQLAEGGLLRPDRNIVHPATPHRHSRATAKGGWPYMLNEEALLAGVDPVEWMGILDLIPVPVVIFDPEDDRTLAANAAAAEFYGMTRVEAGWTATAFSWAGRAGDEPFQQRARSNGEAVFMQVDRRKVDFGDRKAVIDVARDVSEELRLKALNQRLQTRLELTMGAGEIGEWEWDFRSGKVALDERARKLFGKNDDHLRITMPASFDDIDITQLIEPFHPLDVPDVWAGFREHFEGRSEVCALEYRIRTRRGFVPVRECSKIVEWDDAGTATKMLGAYREVGDRHRAEQMSRMIWESPAPALIVENLTIVYANQAAAAFLGAENITRICGQRLPRLACEHDRTSLAIMLEGVSERGAGRAGMTTTVFRMNGDPVAVYLDLHPCEIGVRREVHVFFLEERPVDFREEPAAEPVAHSGEASQ